MIDYTFTTPEHLIAEVRTARPFDFFPQIDYAIIKLPSLSSIQFSEIHLVANSNLKRDTFRRMSF